MTITPLSDSDEQAIRETYLIWSFEHEAWWAPNRCGYRAPHLLDEAGRYSEAEATEICRFANQERPAHSPHEVGVRLTTAVPEIGKLLSELTRLRDECARLAKELGNESRTVEAQSRMIVWCVQRSAQLFRRGDGGNQEMMLAFIPSGQDGLARSEKTGEALPCYTNQIRVSDYPNEGAAVYDLLKIAMRKTGHDVVLVPSESPPRRRHRDEN